LWLSGFNPDNLIITGLDRLARLVVHLAKFTYLPLA